MGRNTPLPPQNIDAEESLLGSLLIDPRAILDVIPLIQPSDFYVQKHTHTLIDHVQAALLDSRDRLRHLSSYLQELYCEGRIESPQSIPIDIPSLDQLLDGLQRSDLIIVDARTGIDKSIQISLSAAQNNTIATWASLAWKCRGRRSLSGSRRWNRASTCNVRAPATWKATIGQSSPGPRMNFPKETLAREAVPADHSDFGKAQPCPRCQV